MLKLNLEKSFLLRYRHHDSPAWTIVVVFILFVFIILIFPVTVSTDSMPIIKVTIGLILFIFFE